MDLLDIEDRKNITSADRARMLCGVHNSQIGTGLVDREGVERGHQMRESRPSLPQHPPTSRFSRLPLTMTGAASVPVVRDRQHADSQNSDNMVPRLPPRVPLTTPHELNVRLPSSAPPQPAGTPQIMQSHTDLFTQASLYPHLKSHRETIKALMLPNGGFLAVKLYYKVFTNDNEWCSARCVSTESPHFSVNYVIYKIASVCNFRSWFRRQKCSRCRKYLARGINDSMIKNAGIELPESEGSWIVPIRANYLWDAGFITSIPHY